VRDRRRGGQPVGPSGSLGRAPRDEGEARGGREALRRLGEAQLLDRDAAAEQRVLGFARPEDAPDAGHQRDLVHRLHEELVRAGLERGDARGVIAAFGEEDHRQAGQTRIGADRAQERDAAARQPFVGDDEVGPVAPRLVEHLGRGRRRSHVVARLREPRPKQDAVAGGGVRDQDAAGHRRASPIWRELFASC
jgi:hypothetical protein